MQKMQNGIENNAGPPVDWKVEPERFGFSPRRLKIVCIGAGFSGLTLAYKLKHERPLNFVDLTIYEKNSDVGGVWLENRYPGVGCDIPAHSYVFPFEPNPSWSKFYTKGPEIQQYILDTTEKYGLRENIVFNTKLLEAIWDESQAKWNLKIECNGSIDEEQTDVLVSGAGSLNRWIWPDVEGIELFKGKLLHTANWDTSYDWTGKRIAVIGNGASGIQVVPALQPKAAKLVNYIRNPTWISVNICGNLTKDGSNFEFTEEEKQKFRENPEEFLAYRKKIESAVNGVFKILISGSEEHKLFTKLCDTLMRERLAKNPTLVDQLIPMYELGCRRISPGDGYLESLQEENARCCFSRIERFTETGIITSEGEESFDLIVCATGYNTEFVPSWKLVGRNGQQLDLAWREKPEAYLSICAAGFPNYFMFLGPNSPLGNGSLPATLGWSADYILDWVEKMASEDIRSIVVRDSISRDYNRYAQQILKRSVWSKGCSSWYKAAKNDETLVTALYPGSVVHFKKMLEIRGEHFDIEYNTSNPFRFMGNGMLDWELDEGADLAFYLK